MYRCDNKRMQGMFRMHRSVKDEICKEEKRGISHHKELKLFQEYREINQRH